MPKPKDDVIISGTDEVISSSPERKLLLDKQGQEITSATSVITLVSKAEDKIALSPDSDTMLAGVGCGITTEPK